MQWSIHKDKCTWELLHSDCFIYTHSNGVNIWANNLVHGGHIQLDWQQWTEIYTKCLFYTIPCLLAWVRHNLLKCGQKNINNKLCHFQNIVNLQLKRTFAKGWVNTNCMCRKCILSGLECIRVQAERAKQNKCLPQWTIWQWKQMIDAVLQTSAPTYVHAHHISQEDKG